MASSKKKKDAVANNVENFAAKDGAVDSGINKISDNFYHVDFASVYIEAGDKEDCDNLHFVNPRTIDCAVAESVGFSTEEMQQLQESIRTRGLLTPLMGRFKDVGRENGDQQRVISLINGHRRYEAISNLVKDNVPCYDPATKQTINARTLYSQIPFKVFDASDDFECYILAFEEDRTKVKFGSGTEARFVQHCRSRMIDDAQILKMTGNSNEWLQATYALIDSLVDDSVVLNNFFNGKIDRGLAKHLASVQDIGERHEMMVGAIDNAEARHRSKLVKIDASIESKLDKIEALTASKACDEFAGRSEDVDAKQAKIEELEGEVIETKKKRSSTGSRAGKADLKKSLKSQGKDKDTDSEVLPTTNRISVKWPEFFKKVVKNGGAIPDQEEFVVPEVLTSYSIALLKAVEDTKADQGEFLCKWLDKFSSSGLRND